MCIRDSQEGRFRKLVKKVQQISYNGKMAVSRGQNMFYVTERAVFQLTEDGPMLIEIARGADLERDIPVSYTHLDVYKRQHPLYVQERRGTL